MNSKPSPGRATRALGLVLILSSTASAQQGYYQQPPRYTQPPPNYYNYQQPPAQRESPLDMIPKIGQKVGQWVRRTFYGDQGYAQPAPNYGYHQGQAQPRQYSAPPPSSGYYQQQPPSYPQQPRYQTPPASTGQPRYNYPPQQPPSTKTPPPPATSKSTSKGKYTPPRIEAPKSRPSSSPSKSSTTTKKPKTEPPPPPQPKEPEVVTTRRSETTKPKEEPTANFPSSSNSGSFLKGKKTGKPGRVISPYPPYKELDITGLDSGSLALDPTTQKVFEVP